VTEFNSRREGLRNVADVVMGMIWLALPCRPPGPPRTCGPRQSRRAPRRYPSTPRSSQALPRRRPWGTPRSRVIDNMHSNRARTCPHEYLKVSLPRVALLSFVIQFFLFFFRMNAHTDSRTRLVDSRSVECWISTTPCLDLSREVTRRGGGVRGGERPQVVRPGTYCSPRHPTHFEPSFIKLNGTL
jgi:hypothetical protein